jgi:hypothetical protein
MFAHATSGGLTTAYTGNSGLLYTPSTGVLSATNHVGTGSISSSTYNGVFSIGTLSYADVNIFASYTANVNSYAQVIQQNTSSGNAASVDFIVSNDVGKSNNYYGDFGINSSTFSGTGALSAANAVYLYASGGDLVVGTSTASAVHLLANNAATDAITISVTNAVTIPGGIAGGTF